MYVICSSFLHMIDSYKKELLSETQTTETYGDRAFNRAGPTLWNK